jgi:hypothetical protein
VVFVILIVTFSYAGSLLTTLAVCAFSLYNAACADSVNLDILTLEKQTLTETMLTKGIKKKANVMRFVYM